MDDPPIPTPFDMLEKPGYNSKGNDREDKKDDQTDKKEIIIESKEYTITNNDNVYKISINKTDKGVLIRSLNYESRLTIQDLTKMTKISLENLDEAYDFIIDVFDNDRAIIKEIELFKVFKIRIIIFGFNGKEKYIDIELLYNKKNKDIIINDLSLKCNSLEEEVTSLKTQISDMNKEMNILKSEINNLKSVIKENKNKGIEKVNNSNQKIENLDKNKLVPKSINFLCDLVKNSYSDWGLDNVFTAFTGVDKIPYLVYSTKEKQIIFMNINELKTINTIKKAHDNYITNIHHFYDKEEKKDIIMTVSAEYNNIKLWEMNDFNNIVEIKKINSQAFLLSACFLIYNNNNYIVTSNGDLKGNNFDSIKLYDFKGKKFLEINNSNKNTNFIKTFYDKEKDTHYIITGNDGYIDSYNINENKKHFTFIEKPYNNSHRSLAVIDYEATKKLVDSCEDGNIRVWDFYSGKLINKIFTGCNPLRGISIFNENCIFIGSKDKTIKVIDINKGIIINSLKGHNNTVLEIEVINLDKYGDCLISQGMDNESIKLWGINYN